jgi:Protein of unknown function (DUF1579)
MTQLPRTPDTEAQRAAIKKLQFLVGKWDGEARIYRKPDEPVVLNQTEEAQFKLGGLLLQIEGIGRTKDGGQPMLQALGIISYDDERSIYHMRAYNDGRFLETDVTFLNDGLSLKWGFTLGEIKTSSLLRISERGEWTELAEISIGAQPARKFMELTVKRVL